MVAKQSGTLNFLKLFAQNGAANAAYVHEVMSRALNAVRRGRAIVDFKLLNNFEGKVVATNANIVFLDAAGGAPYKLTIPLMEKGGHSIDGSVRSRRSCPYTNPKSTPRSTGILS